MGVDTKAEIQRAAGKVGVDESAANLIADYLTENKFGLTRTDDIVPPKVEVAATEELSASSQLRVQPAKSKG